MTALTPATLVESVDRLDGTRVHGAVLTVRHITLLTCGCVRYSCNRPGGGVVNVTRGGHCNPVEVPSARGKPLLAVPA